MGRWDRQIRGGPAPLSAATQHSGDEPQSGAAHEAAKPLGRSAGGGMSKMMSWGQEMRTGLLGACQRRPGWRGVIRQP